MPLLSRGGQEAGRFLLRTSEKPGSGIVDSLREHLFQSIATAAKTDPERAVGAGMSSAVTYLTSNSGFSFPNNNCYAFGANNRTNTYPQPGRKAAFHWTTATSQNLIASLRAGAWKDACLGSPARNISVAAVVAPGADFHFFRRCSDGLWCHKPRPNPASGIAAFVSLASS